MLSGCQGKPDSVRRGSKYLVREDFEGKIQFSVTIPNGVHVQIIRKLPSAKMNRADWIRAAILEKLARDK